ncbi:uncharacterized protein LOC109546666 isoform X2 [Dendroctonus ponderosae]|nr:uncharacterized protein LOC109546666 isoform X2 [Dendroctonus ponderosae]XP_048517714.1 uncharacterized protein LOC109546666 isoform X2 [Dendroctonus ponderosae]XP_048517718.1 uncharacterized protein LOC109546666 isoform X2 [Dendroctonus ponderosae]XP_048517719.1 uncharacterized protein LOC109546666 isoform X2 [Dendroctonus ponderosae]XP_048517720.1 uncharacterized protein LOC109546666 isoform X2 [Dendroctonus ponderosae]XP_048517721.1 uncharacterized protein LOC109546666 isoform X2 [Dendro
MEKINKRLRFTYDDDLALIREFLCENPTNKPERWEVIQKRLEQQTGKCFLIKTLKSHLFLLLEGFVKKDNAHQKTSGIEPYCERDTLLQEVRNLCRATQFLNKKKPISKEMQILQLIKAEPESTANDDSLANTQILYSNEYEIRQLTDNEDDNFKAVDVSMSDLKGTAFEGSILAINMQQEDEILLQSDDGEVDPAKKPLINTPVKRIMTANRKRTNVIKSARKNANDYLKEKSDREQKIKLKQIDLEDRRLKIQERKLVLEEKRVEVELLERRDKSDLEKARINLEVTEKQNLHELIKSQQTIINHLVLRLRKYEPEMS